MNKLREYILRYIDYMVSRKTQTKLLILSILCISALSLIPSIDFELIICIFILMIPMLTVHLIEAPHNYDSFFMNVKNKEYKIIFRIFGGICRTYILKYFKVYLLYATILMLSAFLTFISDITVTSLILSSTEKSVGFLFLSMIPLYLLCLSLRILFSAIVASIYLIEEKLSIFKSAKNAFKFSKYMILKHIFIVLLFMIVTFPLIKLSSYLYNFWQLRPLSYTGYGVYILLILNFIIFDLKVKQENLKDTIEKRNKYRIFKKN